MATLGTSWTTIGSGSFSSGGATLTYYIEAKLNSQSVAGNTSSISTRARTVFSGYSMSSYNVHMSCTGCTPYDGNNSTIYYFGTKVVLEGGVTVAHNSDGTGSLSMSGACTGNLGMNIRPSGSINLPAIPRASKPTVSSNPLTIGQTQVISTNRASTSFTHQIVISMNGYTQTYTDVSTSVSWATDAETLMPHMDTWQQTVTITCTTYNGSTQIGSAQTATFKLQMDTSVYKPVIGSVTKADTNAVTSALESSGTFIKDYSDLQLTIPLSINNTDYNCALYKATVIYNGQTSVYNLSGTSQTITFLARVSASTVTIKAMDNRGYEVTQTINLSLIEYQPISISSVSYVRVNTNDVESETGEYVRYTIVANAFLGSFGQVTNQITVKSESKAASASSYDPQVIEKTVTTSGSGNAQTTITGVTVGTYSPSSQFDIIFTLTDALSSATAVSLRIHEGIPVYAWGEHWFDIFGELHIHNRDDITEYTTLSYKGYDWKIAGSASSTTAINFDSTICTEIMLVARYVEDSTHTWMATATVPTDVLTTDGFFLMMPSRISAVYSQDKGCLIQITDTYARINEWYDNRNFVAGNATLSVYYR